MSKMFGRGLFGAIAFFLLAVSSFATTAVTGTLQNLGTGTVGQGAFVRFWLRGCGGNQPRVNGTSVIAPSQGGVFFFDLTANSSGVISGTIYSTRDSTGLLGGDITCGVSTTSAWYGMQIFVGGKGGPEVAIHAKNGVPFDISSVTPINTNPVVVAPTGDSTYLRIDNGNGPATNEATKTGNNAFSGNNTHSGTETFTGLLQAKNIESTRFVDSANSQGWAGADVCAWLVSAKADLPAAGGLVDARGVTGAMACAAGAALGDATKGVSYLFENTNITISSPITLICPLGACHIYGDPAITRITQSATFPASTPTIQIGSTGEINVTVEGVYVTCNASVSNSIGFETLAQDFSGPRRAIAQNCTKYGFWHEGANANLSLCDNCYALTKGATANGFYIHNVNRFSGYNMTSVANGGVPDPVASQIVFDGSSGAIFNCHVEDATNGVDNGPVASSILEVHNCTGGPAVTTVIRNENVSSNRLTAYSTVSNSATNSILDSLNGITRTDTYMPRYQTFGPTGNQVWMEDGTVGRIFYHAGTNQNIRMESQGSFMTLEAINDALGGDVPLSLGATTVLPANVGSEDLGTAANPWTNFWLGTAATNNWKLQPGSTTGARIITMTDPLSPTTVGLPLTIASGTSTLTANAALAAVTSQAAITTAGTGILTTDTIDWSYASAPTAGDSLCIVSAYVTAGNVNFVRGNPTAAAQNVSALVINWRVRR